MKYHDCPKCGNKAIECVEMWTEEDFAWFVLKCDYCNANFEVQGYMERKED
jgi:transcription elongation factor Elf1